MPKSDVETLTKAINTYWSQALGDKAKRYVGQFYNATRRGTKITAQVEGNHGTYTVSVQAEGQRLSAACSCYIGKGGSCHHCHALGLTFLSDPSAFREIKAKALDEVRSLPELEEYLQGTTLDALLSELKAHGTSQKAFAESIGMNPRHLSAIRSSELRNRFYNELGATKLACLWVLEHIRHDHIERDVTEEFRPGDTVVWWKRIPGGEYVYPVKATVLDITAERVKIEAEDEDQIVVRYVKPESLQHHSTSSSDKA
jgi:hypothetical protein